jgi:hypothetical protein
LYQPRLRLFLLARSRYNENDPFRMSPKARKIKLLVVVLSLFVFLLALNAKLSMYDQPEHTATSTSKLWLNGQKMEGQTPVVLIIAVLAVVFLPLRLRFPRSPWPEIDFSAPARSPLPAFETHRFLRPPPLR